MALVGLVGLVTASRVKRWLVLVIGIEHHWCRTRFLQLKALEDMDKTVEEIKRGLDMNK